jgi:hypothetical protein
MKWSKTLTSVQRLLRSIDGWRKRTFQYFADRSESCPLHAFWVHWDRGKVSLFVFESRLMRKFTLSLMALICLIPAAGFCQEETTPTPAATEQVPSAAEDTPADSGEPESAFSTDEKKSDVAKKAKELEAEVEAKVGELAEKIDQNESAKKAAEGVLGPIYKLAESLNFSSFHWLAFGLMSAGVVSFALQLVLGKLVVLFKGSINLREIISDAIGFVISTVGLVLTTQAAAENSTFTHSPAAVLSSAACGVVLGFMLYRWGQMQEVNAVAGQRAVQPIKSQSKG